MKIKTTSCFKTNRSKLDRVRHTVFVKHYENTIFMKNKQHFELTNRDR